MKQAIEIVINAAPASLPVINATGSVDGVPSNTEIRNEGMITSSNPVMASISPVIFKNNFNLSVLPECVNSVDSVTSIYFTMLSKYIKSNGLLRLLTVKQVI